MGIYVTKASALKELLEVHMPGANDFGNEVIPGAREMGYHIQAHAFQGYWEDIGTIEAFYNANLALAAPGKTDFSFYDKDAPIYTMSRFLPPSKVADAEIVNAIIGDGCVVKSRAVIRNSVIGLRTLVMEGAVIEDTLMLGADYYETKEECSFVPGCQPIGVGRNSVVRKALVDKNVRIGNDVKIINKDNLVEANREDEGFIIKDGIVVVVKNARIADGTVI